MWGNPQRYLTNPLPCPDPPTNVPPFNYAYLPLGGFCLRNGLGYDEGGFSASIGLKSFQRDFGLESSRWKDNPSGLADRKANISSFGVLGAAFGAFLAVAICDKLGRLRSWQIFTLTWMSGLLMQIFSSGILGFMLFARIWGGLGAGGLTVVAPLYLSEIAPAKSRGAVFSMYMVALLTFLSLGMHANPIGHLPPALVYYLFLSYFFYFAFTP